MSLWAGPGFLCPALVHRQDEPTKLSLGMVASQQSPLSFHSVRRLYRYAVSSCGNNFLPSYGVRGRKMP